MALELKYASDATALLDDLVDSLGRPGAPAGVVVEGELILVEIKTGPNPVV